MRLIFKILPALSLLLIFSIQSSAQNQLNYDCDLELPSVLTANQNADSITFECPCEIIEMEFTLYNRWGQKIYSSQSIDSPFDLDVHARKKDGGFHIEAGTYFWNADYSVLVGDIVLELKRNSTITIVH